MDPATEPDAALELQSLLASSMLLTSRLLGMKFSAVHWDAVDDRVDELIARLTGSDTAQAAEAAHAIESLTQLGAQHGRAWSEQGDLRALKALCDTAQHAVPDNVRPIRQPQPGW